MPKIVSIYRYPVKGLSAEPLTEVELRADEGLPLDRAYALARPDAPFDAVSANTVPVALVGSNSISTIGCVPMVVVDGASTAMVVDGGAESGTNGAARPTLYVYVVPTTDARTVDGQRV